MIEILDIRNSKDGDTVCATGIGPDGKPADGFKILLPNAGGGGGGKHKGEIQPTKSPGLYHQTWGRMVMRSLPIEGDFCIAEKIIMHRGAGTTAGKELIENDCKRHACFRHVDHLRGIETWTFKDESQLVRTGAGYRVINSKR